MDVSVAFLIFNRPDTTERVFETIRQVNPNKLLVIADGPRPGYPEDIEKCEKARIIIEQVDWDCQVLTNFSDINLGCAKRVSSGLDWVFSQVEEAIILEDDCLPHPTLFRFCDELLEYYRHDNRIAVISGQNVQFGRRRTDYSYYFSRYNHCWGWATWRRAWQYFDFDMTLWPIVRDGSWLEDILMDKKAARYWSKIFQATYEGKFDSWGYRWTFSCWIQNFLSILSDVNLVSNIGFGLNSTNTKRLISKFANMPSSELEFPLKHPPFLIRDSKADNYTQRTLYETPLSEKALIKFKKFIVRE